MTCPFVPAIQGPSPGLLSLSFTTPKAGILSWPGGSTPITRAIYGTREDVRQLLGSWVLSADEGSTQSGDMIRFSSYSAASSTSSASVAGTNVGGREVAGLISNGLVIIVVDDSTSYFDFYLFDFNSAGLSSLGEGHFWRYLKSAQPSGLGDPARGLKYEPAPFGTALEIPKQLTETSDARESLNAFRGMLEAASGK